MAKDEYDLWYQKHQQLTHSIQDDAERRLVTLEAEKTHREEQLKLDLVIRMHTRLVSAAFLLKLSDAECRLVTSKGGKRRIEKNN